MNKLTKVGCSALCGSLAAISAANAGELTVTGGADMTWVSKSGAVTGNPIGIGSNFSLKGSGELDNGWTYDLTIANTNAGAFSAANIGITMGGLGKLNINQGDSGNGIAAFDDKMPTAWEESWGAGLSTGVRLPLGSGASTNIQYTTPTMVGTTMTFTVAPDYGSSDTADKTTASTEDEIGKSYDATININPTLGTEILTGLNIFVGGAVIDRVNNGTDPEEDAYEAVGGITFDLGPISIGSQVTGEFTGDEQAADNIAYKSHAYGVAFNVNDDLSVSYGKWEQRKAGYGATGEYNQGGENDKLLSVSSWQAAYTMGGASIRIAETKADNAGWSAGNNTEATTVSLGLAF